MANLAGLKVVIGLKTNGNADYPNFNTLASVQAEGMDWTKYIEAKGKGWLYDKKSGHQDDDPNEGQFDDSPAGTQIGIILAPETFVDEAVAAFPSVCSRVTDTECGTFHDQRCTHTADEVQHDQGQLQNLYYELQLLEWLKIQYPGGAAQTKIASALTKLGQRAIKALDEDDEDAKGIVKNQLKAWIDRKVKQKITFVDPS